MIKRILICSVLMFMVALPFASCEDKAPKNSSGAKPGMPYKITAPDINLRSVSGKAWRLSDYRGKIVMLDFTTTWCPYCLKDIPNLKKTYEKYKGQGLEFVAIYIQESQKRVSSFAEKHSLPYGVLLDPDGKAAMSYGVRGVPTKIIVDKDGVIVCWMCSDNDMEGYLEKNLKKK